jgi:beige protein homolog 1
VRELIPEFFFCPELFINHNRIHFGRKQDGDYVDNVKLPPWCQSDPYLFVIYMREAFESQYVSQNLNGWIDYIFGYKQREGEAAERALNTFSRVTYEDGVDLETVSDPMQRQSYQEQIYNYGQTPSQLFSKQ